MNQNLVVVYDTLNLVPSDNIPDLVSKIENIGGVSIGELKITDLVLPAESCTGIYFFLDENEQVVYVGKISSRSFLDRIAGHLDLRKSAFMNTILQRANSNAEAKDYGDVFYNKVVNYKLKICAVKGNAGLNVNRIICELERGFIRHYAGNGHLLNKVPKSFMSI